MFFYNFTLMEKIKKFLILVFIFQIGFSCAPKRRDIEMLEKGKVFFLNDKFTEALPYFTKSISYNTINDETHAYRGYCQFMLDNYAEAMIDFSTALNHNPNNGVALFGQACIKWNLEDYVQAFQEFDKLLQINPEHNKAYYYRGRALLHFGDTLNGLKDLNTALEKDSSFIDTYYLIASVKTRQNKFAEADEILEKALKLEKQSK